MSSVHCPKCAHHNRDGRHYCSKCGHSLFQVCPECNFENESNCRYCGGCGKPLQDSVGAAFSSMGGDSGTSVFYEAVLTKTIYSQQSLDSRESPENAGSDAGSRPLDDEATALEGPPESDDAPNSGAPGPGSTGVPFPFTRELICRLLATSSQNSP